MRKFLILIFTLVLFASAQNAAVSSYFKPRYSATYYDINYKDSVYLDSTKSDIRIREVRVPSDGLYIGTYYCTMGYFTPSGTSTGYGGIQYTSDISKGPKNYIYSQWNDYTTVAYSDSETDIEAFGGEGTGQKSINHDPGNQWTTDYWHVTSDRVWKEGSNTYFAFIAKNGETGIWTHMITWNTPEAGVYFKGGGYYFLEDWTGDGNYRSVHMRRAYSRTVGSGNWFHHKKFLYDINDGDITSPTGRSRDNNNWLGGVASDGGGQYFYMAAGGGCGVSNNDYSDHIVSNSTSSPQELYGVHKITSLTAIPFDSNNKLRVLWDGDNTSVPQFAYTLTIKDGGTTVLTKTDTIPQKRSDTLDISSLSPEVKLYTVTLNITDFFDGSAASKTTTFGNGAGGYLLVTEPSSKKTYSRGDTVSVEWISDLTSGDCKISLLSTSSVDSIGTEPVANGSFNLIIPADAVDGSGYRAVVTIDTLSDSSAAFSVYVPDSTNMILNNSHIESATASSEQGGRPIENAFDGDATTLWHTEYSPTLVKHPHIATVELDTIYGIKGLIYMPRQDGGPNGTIKNYKIEVSRNSQTWSAVKEDSFSGTTVVDTAFFGDVKASKFIRITALSEINGGDWASAAEFSFIYDATWIDDSTPVVNISKQLFKGINIIQKSSVIEIQNYNPGELWSAELISLNGRTIFSSGRNNNPSVKIDTAELNLSKGVYVLKAGNVRRMVMMK